MILERICLWIVAVQGIAAALALAGFAMWYGINNISQYREGYRMLYSKASMRKKAGRLHEKAGLYLDDYDKAQATREAGEGASSK